MSIELHKRLWLVCQNKEDYLSGKDTNNHELPDCSSGCRWFVPLEGQGGFDWGVCSCSKSPRAGLLTFEHMGCKEYEFDGEEDDTMP
jgi:hypothetical protein